MITAYGDAETKRQALANGAEALLTEPIDFKTFRSEIDIRGRTRRITSRNLLQCVRRLMALFDVRGPAR